MSGRFLTLALLLVACWPTVFWYAGRVTDGSDEPWGLLAIVTLVALIYRRKPQPERDDLALLLVSALLVVYISGFWWAPQLVRAVLAATALAIIVSTQFFGKRFHVGTWALAVLSLPLISSMQFYLGYPLRLAVSALTAALLQLNGLAVVPEDACLRWHGELVAIDAPCSGIKMLWTSLYVAATLASTHKLSSPRSLLLLCLATLLALAGNVIRATSLFFIQSGIVEPIAALPPPDWLHNAIGLVSFACVLLVVTLAATWARAPVDRRMAEGARAPVDRRMAEGARAPVDRRMAEGAHRMRPHGSLRSQAIFSAVAFVAAIIPLLPVQASPPVDMVPFPGFPSQFDGQRLTQIPLSAQEQKFAAGFPGKIAKFTTGRRQVVLRWISKETRQLHPSSDCYKGSGYSVKPLPLSIDSAHRTWSTFEATRGKDRMKISERISDNSGRAWTDPSQWYWAAVLKRTEGPWWAVTLVEPADP